MSAMEAVARFGVGWEPFKVRFVLNRMYVARVLSYNTYWEALEITMEMQEVAK